LRWINKNWKIKKIFSVTSPNITPTHTIINQDDSIKQKNIQNKEKDMSPIEVNFKKDIFIDKADNTDIVSDEKIKGKVKTQKDKLRKLKGK